MRQVLRPNLFMNHVTSSFVYEHEKKINKWLWQYILKVHLHLDDGNGLTLGLNEKSYPFLEIVPQKHQSFSNQILKYLEQKNTMN